MVDVLSGLSVSSEPSIKVDEAGDTTLNLLRSIVTRRMSYNISTVTRSPDPADKGIQQCIRHM